MAFYPREWLDEVRERSNIVEIIGAHVQLKRAGNSYKGLCPFHGEKTPSFNVSEERQFYHCFGCNVTGDVFTFLQEYERMDFNEAVKFLAERARMPIPDMTGDAQGPTREERDRLHEALTEAARYYNARLYAPEGKQALDYLHGRGLGDKVIRRFGLGATGAGWTGLRDYLREKGFADTELEGAGLISVRDSGSFDMFRERAMFPIFDRRGKVVAFGGRILGDGNPKYLNSSDTPVFHKRSTVYGLNFMKGRQQRIYLVEGYMDVVSLCQHGVRSCVATLGTALTNEQAKMISRAADEVVIVYDGDGAGQRATARALDIFDAEGITGRVMVIPEKADPDDFVRKHGGAAFHNLPLLDATTYRLDRAREEFDLAEQGGRTQYAIHAAEILRRLPNAVEIENHIKRLAVETGYTRDVLYEQIGRSPKRRSRVEDAAHTQAKTRDTTVGEPDFVKAQQELISILAGGQTPPGTGDLTIEDFDDPICRRMAEAIFASPGDPRAVSRVLGQTEDERERAKIGAILAREEQNNPETLLERIRHYRRTLTYHALEVKYAAMQERLKDTGERPPAEYIRAILELQTEMNKYKPMPTKE